MGLRDNRVSWDAIRIFLAIARAGTLRGAAEALAVNHATVARALDILEANLETRLFDRGRLGLKLTQAGEDLIGTAERMEVEAQTIQRQVLGRDAEPSGRVRISIPPLLAYKFLAKDFASFVRTYPEIDLDVSITNRFTDLSRREEDVSIRLTREVDDDVVGRRLIQYVKGIYASPAYLAARPELRIGDGAEADWIGWGDAESKPAWIRASPFPNAPLRHAMPEAVLQVEAAAAGMGLTYLPAFIGDPDPRLQRVLGIEPSDDRSIWLLLHGDLRATARVRAFVDFMAAKILEKRALLRGYEGDSKSILA